MNALEREATRSLSELLRSIEMPDASRARAARIAWNAGWRPVNLVQRAACVTFAIWLKARRDEHTPGNYPYWLLDCLYDELREAMAEGHLPGTELQRLAAAESAERSAC